MREASKKVTGVDDRGAHAFILARRGRKSEAQVVLNEWIRGAQTRASITCGIAEVYTVLGDHGRAFEWLDRAYAERNPMLSYIKVWPSFQPLRSDPRFSELLNRLGLN
jgi:hypothetical protein